MITYEIDNSQTELSTIFGDLIDVDCQDFAGIFGVESSCFDELVVDRKDVLFVDPIGERRR